MNQPRFRMTPELAELWRLRFQLQEAAAMVQLSPQSAYTPEMMTVMEKMRDTWDGLMQRERIPQVETMKSIKEKLDAEHVAGYSAPGARAAYEYGNDSRSQCEALKPAIPERPDYRYRSSRHDDRPPLKYFHEFVRDIDTGTVEVNSDVERDALLRAGRAMLTGLHGLEEAHLRALHLLERSDSNWHRGRRGDEDDHHHHDEGPDGLSVPPQDAEEVGQPDSQRYWVASEPDDESIRGIIPCQSCGSWHCSRAQDRRISDDVSVHADDEDSEAGGPPEEHLWARCSYSPRGRTAYVDSISDGA